MWLPPSTPPLTLRLDMRLPGTVDQETGANWEEVQKLKSTDGVFSGASGTYRVLAKMESMNAGFMGASGAALLGISAYLQICNQSRKRWLRRIIDTPETSVSASPFVLCQCV